MDRTEGVKPNGKSNGTPHVTEHQLQLQEDLHSPPPPYRHADSGEIKRDIRQTRSALDETIDALTDRLQPRRLAHEVLDRVIAKFEGRSGEMKANARIKAREVASNAGDTIKHASSSAASYAKVYSKRAGRSLGHSVKENPLGFALIGAGVAYLLFSGRKRDEDDMVALDDGRIVRRIDVVRRPVSVYPEVEYEYGEYGETYGPTYGTDTGLGATSGSVESIPVGRPITTSVSGTYQSPESGTTGPSRKARVGAKLGAVGANAKHKANVVGHGVKNAASTVGHGIKTAGNSVGHGIMSAGHGIKTAASSAGHGIKTAASSVGHGIGHGAEVVGRNARQGYSWTAERGARQIKETPLLMSLGALALGVLVGALLPNTRKEHRALGPTRDSFFAGIKDIGEEVAMEGRRVARHTMNRATDELYSEGLNPDQLANELEGLANEVANAARDSLERRDLSGKIKRAAKHTAETAVNEASGIKNVVTNRIKGGSTPGSGGGGQPGISGPGQSLGSTRVGSGYGSTPGGSTLGKPSSGATGSSLGSSTGMGGSNIGSGTGGNLRSGIGSSGGSSGGMGSGNVGSGGLGTSGMRSGGTGSGSAGSGGLGTSGLRSTGLGSSGAGNAGPVHPRGTNLTSQATTTGPMNPRNIERPGTSSQAQGGLGTTRNPSAGNVPSRSVPSSSGSNIPGRVPGSGSTPGGWQGSQGMSGLEGNPNRPKPIPTGGATSRNVDDESNIDPSTGNKKRTSGPIRNKRDSNLD